MLNYYKLWYYNYSNRKQKERNGEVDGDGCLVMDSAVEIFVPV